MAEAEDQDEGHQGNWYVLTMGLPRPDHAMTLAPGLSLRPLDQPLSVFKLADAGVVGFRQWAALEAISLKCQCEIESAKDSDITPGYNTLNRAWLASTLLVLRGYTSHICVASSIYPWNDIATKDDDSMLPPFKGGILDYRVRHLTAPSSKTGPVTDEDAEWVRTHFDVFNRLAVNPSFRFALEAAVEWRHGLYDTRHHHYRNELS